MAKNTQPIAKRCKALGISPAVMGYAKKNTTRNSNGNVRKKQSEYASQLKEKQKVKFYLRRSGEAVPQCLPAC